MISFRDKDEMEFQPGKYKDYKGGEYTALMLVVHHETRQKLVLYVSHTTGAPQVREWQQLPLIPMLTRSAPVVDAWTDIVLWPDGNYAPRFIFVRPNK